MTANRCRSCGGRLRAVGVDKHVPKHRQQPKSFRCRKCGREWQRVKRRWVQTERLI